ncbi:MAG: hypothetical protein IMZ52_03550, partial [Actinobacteria bacterium]|nr:hypothetical protein [Actinomycetota bacterium]
MVTSIGTIQITIQALTPILDQLKQVNTGIANFGKNLKGITGKGIDTSGATKDFGVFMKRIDSGIYGAQEQFSNLNESGKNNLNELGKVTDVTSKRVVNSTKQMKQGIIGQLLDVQTFVGQIVHYITFSIGVQLVMGIKKGFADLRESFVEFEKNITDVVAVTGYVGSAFDDVKERISKLARVVSKESIYSAVEVSKAFYDIASAGYDVSKMTKEQLIPFT